MMFHMSSWLSPLVQSCFFSPGSCSRAAQAMYYLWQSGAVPRDEVRHEAGSMGVLVDLGGLYGIHNGKSKAIPKIKLVKQGRSVASFREKKTMSLDDFGHGFPVSTSSGNGSRHTGPFLGAVTSGLWPTNGQWTNLRLKRGFHFLCIMAKVFTASVSPSQVGNGDVSVTIVTSFSGEDVCSFQMSGGKLADLEGVLVDSKGLMTRCSPFCRVCRLLFYTEDEPSRPLDLQRQVGTFDSLVIKHGDSSDVELQTYPDTGKFLQAVLRNKFDPCSRDFEIKWTAKVAGEVTLNEAKCLVHEVLNGSPIHQDSGQNFVQIFGKLAALGESWRLLDLRFLQNVERGLKTFKHCVFQHWLELARVAATSMISEATPMLLLKRSRHGDIVGCSVIGDAFPGNFDHSLQTSLELSNDTAPDVLWRNVSRVLLSLDWNPQEGLEALQTLLTKVEQEPTQFRALQQQEVSQMVQVQLRLSCCRVAEVKGPINEVCVKMLAELLAYKLMILRFESMLDLKTQTSAFHGDKEDRGTLVLVTDIPASERPIFCGPHLLILCYR